MQNYGILRRYCYLCLCKIREMLKYLGYLIQLILSPGRGWDDIALSKLTPKSVASEGFYPLLGVASCSVFVQYFYDTDLTLPVMIESAVIAFVSYFISYFIASFMFAVFGRQLIKGEPDEKRYNLFILFNLSILALISIIGNCLPMTLSLVEFLPVFVLLVMWMGHRYLNVMQGKEAHFTLFCGLAILLPPFLLEYLFKLLLPGN